jgi:hypothetical protein
MKIGVFARKGKMLCISPILMKKHYPFARKEAGRTGMASEFHTR